MQSVYSEMMQMLHTTLITALFLKPFEQSVHQKKQLRQRSAEEYLLCLHMKARHNYNGTY